VGAEKDKMIPTALGLSCLQFCLKEFPTLFAYDFTSHMETRLDKVAQGQEFWKNLCRDTWNSYKDHLQELKHKKGGSTQSGPNPKVREFGDGLKAVLGKKGPILLREDPSGAKEKTVFYGWPEGKGFHDLTDQDAKAFLSAKQQPTSSNWGTFDGNPIVEKKGPFGAYFECAGVRVPMGPGETPESLHQKFQQKLSANQHSLGSFEFRQGPYGMYMFKKAAGGKKPAFVGLPEGLDPKTLTLEAAERIYKNGLEQKKAAPPARGGYRGRGGRGGRGRGGGPVSH
jgi:topoisomerase IA-like protein